MAPPVFNKGIGGVTPLGVLTVTAGNPVQVTSNLKISDQFFSFLCRQLGFSVDSGASGPVLVNYGNFAGKGNQTAMIIQPATSQSFPIGASATESEIDPSKWYLDVETGSASVAVYALDATS